jgi:hypothetical protein
VTSPDPARPGTPGAAGADPVVARRRRIARLADAGQRGGYLLFGLAIVAFVVGVVTDFPRPVVTVVVAALAVGSILLAPAIVLGYAVRAADRDDRERGLG